MTGKLNSKGILSRLRKFRSDRRGVAAVEFALILPVMLTIYIGGIEIGDGFAINSRVTDVAHSVTDLATQYISIDSQDMTAVLGASSSIMAPYSTTGMVVTVSEVTADKNGNGFVTWSNSLNGTARANGSALTLPAPLIAQAKAQFTSNGTYMVVVLGEVSYPYTPSIGYVLTSTITMSDSFYLMPRLSNCITYNNYC